MSLLLIHINITKVLFYELFQSKIANLMQSLVFTKLSDISLWCTARESIFVCMCTQSRVEICQPLQLRGRQSATSVRKQVGAIS